MPRIQFVAAYEPTPLLEEKMLETRDALLKEVTAALELPDTVLAMDYHEAAARLTQAIFALRCRTLPGKARQRQRDERRDAFKNAVLRCGTCAACQNGEPCLDPPTNL